jgi:enoyl-CoA hydratase/carnithine racemase
VRPGGGVADARFAVSGVNLGLFCSTPSVALSRNLSRKAAFEMLVTGDFISADEARAKGLVNRVVPAEQLDAEVERLVARIVAKPRVAMALGKGCSTASSNGHRRRPTTTPAQTMACNMMDEAALEGVQAFIDKRPPRWSRACARRCR